MSNASFDSSVQMAELLAEVRSYLPNLELEDIERGLRKRNKPQALTELSFQMLEAKSPEGRLLGLAQIVTRISDPDLNRLDQWDVATANRWAVWGHIRHVGPGEFEILCSITLHWGAPDGWKTYAGCIANAFRQQAAFAMASLSSRISEEEFRQWRYSVPRAWRTQPPDDAFSRAAERVRGTGLWSEARERELEFLQPLSPRPSWCGPERAALRVQISSRYTHPVAGVGYSATLTIPRVTRAQQLSEYLNAEEEKQTDFVPRFGAWGIAPGSADVVYSLFWPEVDGASSAGMVEQLGAWQLLRAKWLARLVAEPHFFKGQLSRGYRQQRSSPEEDVGLRDEFLNAVSEYARSEPLQNLVTDVQRKADAVVFRRTPGPGVSTISVQGGQDDAEDALRVIVKTDAIPELQEVLLGQEHVRNIMAGTAALVAHGGGMSFVASAPLERWSAGLCWGLTVEATAVGVSAILGSNPKDRKDDRPVSLSVWGDIELERLRYTYSHRPLIHSPIGITQVLQRGEHLLSIELTSRERHPALGAGLLCLLRVTSLTVPENMRPRLVNFLNAWEFEHGETPFFGAWCIEPGSGNLTFAMFMENVRQNRDSYAEYLFGSMLLRADDFFENFIRAWNRSIACPGPEAI